MKIGILTQPLHTNYGGLLQAFALQTVLKRMGHTVLTVDWAHDNSYMQWVIDCCKASIHRLMLHPAHVPLLPYKVKYMRRFTDSFIASYIAITESMHRISAKKLEKYGFDAYVVGSDQVWRLAYNAHIEWMYLSFVKDRSVKRVAYAASFGIDYWDYPQTISQTCADLAQRFDCISVREKEAVRIVNDNLGMPAQCVLDPTLLLNADDYEQILSLPKAKPNGSIGVYMLDMNEEKLELLNALQHQLHCNIHIIDNPNTQNRHLNYKERQSPAVEDWLNGIRQSDYVVTDSFHGTAFSIIFHKSFICLGNKNRGNSRFSSILGITGLGSRLLDSSTELLPDAVANLLCEPIDWPVVDMRKQSMQNTSYSLLATYLRQ